MMMFKKFYKILEVSTMKMKFNHFSKDMINNNKIINNNNKEKKVTFKQEHIAT